MPGSPHRTWPPPEAYRYLESASRSDLAWEWLRRDPDFRRLVPSVTRKAVGGFAITEPASPECEARWGCLHVPDPGLRFTDTPVLWSADVDQSVLRVVASSASEDDRSAFDLRRWGAAVTLVISAHGRESLLLRDAGRRCLRLQVVSGSLQAGPVSLFLDLGSVHDVEPAIVALRRYLHLCRTDELPPLSRPTHQPTRRLITALRVHDARVEGASIRDVGVMLFGIDRVQAEWPGPGEAFKSQCRRLIALARFMASGGYRTLLS
jgi:hypothetical protein